MQEEVLKRLDLIAAKLGTTVDHLWPVLLHQQQIDGICNTLAFVACVCLIVGLWKVTGRAMRPELTYSNDDILWLGRVVGGATLFIFGACCFRGALTCFFNPEFAALTDLAAMFKK